MIFNYLIFKIYIYYILYVLLLIIYTLHIQIETTIIKPWFCSYILIRGSWLLDQRKNILNIEVSPETDTKIQISNINGRILKTLKIKGTTELDVADLPTGMYLISLQTKHSASRTKLLKIQ